MLVDLPRNWRYSSSIVQALPITGVVVSTPQAVVYAKKGVSMFLSEAIMFLFWE
jgi:hypothetical protein